MGCVIDHLERDHRLTVLREFVDLRGAAHAAGETGVLREVGLDWARQEIWLRWERDGRDETLVFALAAREGPRNGAMKQFFEKGEYVSDRRDPRTSRAKSRPKPAIPEVSRDFVSDPAHFEEGVQRVWALAARHRFDEAAEQIDALLTDVGEMGWRVERLAGSMESLAAAHAGDANREVFDWLYERALTLWHAWGAMATSGGEGAVRGREIRAAGARLDALRA